MYIVYLEDDSIDSEFRSPVAAELRVLDLAKRGVKAFKVYDEGGC